VPSLGIKIDAVPHRINTGLIYLQRTGVFYGQCSEICGVNHGFMPIVVHSMTIDEFMAAINNMANPILNELVDTDPDYEMYKLDIYAFSQKLYDQNPEDLDLFRLVYFLDLYGYTYDLEKFYIYDAALDELYNNTADYDTPAFFDFFFQEAIASQIIE